MKELKKDIEVYHIPMGVAEFWTSEGFQMFSPVMAGNIVHVPHVPIMFGAKIEKEADGEAIIAIAMVENHTGMEWPWPLDQAVDWAEAKPYLEAVTDDKPGGYDYPPASIIAWTATKVIYHHVDNEYAPMLETLRRNP